jgi:PAS domain S-box-containing protein
LQETKKIDAVGLGEIAYACVWAIPVPIVVLEDDAIVFVNAALLEMLGYDDPWSLIGCSIDTILHPDAREASTGRRAIVAGGGRLAKIPSKVLTRAGEGIAARVTAEQIDVDGGRLTLVQASGEPRHWPAQGWPEPPNLGHISNPLGLAVLEAFTVPVIVHTSTALLFANAIARQQLGAQTLEEITGRPMLSVIHPESLLSTMERGLFFFATRQPIRNVPIKLRGLNGATLRVSADAYPVRSGAKSVALVMGVDDEDSLGS